VIWPLLLVVLSSSSFLHSPSLVQASKPHLPSQVEASQATNQPSLESVSREQYRDRILALQKLLAGCRQAISASHCQSDGVGPDIRVSLPSGGRTIRFGWLKALMEDAARYDPAKDESAPAKRSLPTSLPVSGSSPVVPTKASPANDPGKIPAVAPQDELDAADAATPLPARLDQARERLAQDLNSIAQGTAAKPVSSAAQRKALTSILSAKEYHAATVGRTLKDRILEKIAGWINQAIEKLIRVGSQSEWIGVATEIAFVSILCVALVWFLIRLEKQGRFGSAMFQGGASAGAPSERDWQLWLKDAKEAAGSGAWREAIHFLYWASISRLESSGQWSADRARTPREYLALLSAGTSQRAELKSGLTALTRSFERTWYGGRPAVEEDFQKAEQLAATLGAKSEASSDWRGGSR
jgi:hypothetical protein